MVKYSKTYRRGRGRNQSRRRSHRRGGTWTPYDDFVSHKHVGGNYHPPDFYIR